MVGGTGVWISVCVSFRFLVYCVLFFVLGFRNPSFSEWSESPSLVLLYVEQAGVSLCTHFAGAGVRGVSSLSLGLCL